MRNKTELIKRYAVFIIGLMANALGVALITKSALGTGPTTCIPYVASLAVPVSFGTCTFLFNALLLVFQMLLLRGKFEKHQLLQLPFSFVFAAFIDVAMMLCAFVRADNYVMALVLVVLGCVCRAFGVSCQVVADVVMLSSEAFVKAVADVIRKDFSVVKLVSDGTMSVIAIVMSLVFFGNVTGVREGTLITVILVAPISHIFTRRLGFTRHYFEHEGQFVYESNLKMVEGKRLVVTISYEDGSGGSLIGRLLGEKLNLPVYDNEIVELVAKEGNFSLDYVKRHNERLYSNVVEAFIKENYHFGEDEMESFRELYEAQERVIEKLAREQDCIIIGHCSNHILRKMEGSLHIHIYADLPHRLKYVMAKYKINAHKAFHLIHHHDQEKYQYYLHFTGDDWKKAQNYHMTIDSTLFGYEGTAELLEQIVKKDYMDLPKISVKEAIQKYHILVDGK